MSKQDVLRVASRFRLSVVCVEQAGAPAELIGYRRVIDMGLSRPGELGPICKLLEIPAETTHVAALMRMQNARESLAQVVNADGRVLGIVTDDRLRDPVFRGGW